MLVKSHGIRTGFQLDRKVPLDQLIVVGAQAEKVVRARRDAGKLCLAACIGPRARNGGGIRGVDSRLASRLVVRASCKETLDRGDSSRRLNACTRQSCFIALVHQHESVPGERILTARLSGERARNQKNRVARRRAGGGKDGFARLRNSGGGSDGRRGGRRGGGRGWARRRGSGRRWRGLRGRRGGVGLVDVRPECGRAAHGGHKEAQPYLTCAAWWVVFLKVVIDELGRVIVGHAVLGDVVVRGAPIHFRIIRFPRVEVGIPERQGMSANERARAGVDRVEATGRGSRAARYALAVRDHDFRFGVIADLELSRSRSWVQKPGKPDEEGECDLESQTESEGSRFPDARGKVQGFPPDSFLSGLKTARSKGSRKVANSAHHERDQFLGVHLMRSS